MEVINLDGISFPVAKYKIVRLMPGGDSYADEIYLPTDVKLYKYDDYNSKVKFEDNTYSQQFYFGITKWSEEKERIAQNMHYDILGEKDNYPVINSVAFTSYSLFDKYLIYVLKNAAPYIGETLPLTDQFPTIPETFYVKRTKVDDNVFDQLMEWAKKKEEYSEEDYEKKIEGLNQNLMMPIQYIKINGFENGESFDATVIDVKSVIFDKEVNSIGREPYEISLLCDGEIDNRTHFKEITKDEYDNAFNAMLTKF